jgi:hypothetical protein
VTAMAVVATAVVAAAVRKKRRPTPSKS